MYSIKQNEINKHHLESKRKRERRERERERERKEEEQGGDTHTRLLFYRSYKYMLLYFIKAGA